MEVHYIGRERRSARNVGMMHMTYVEGGQGEWETALDIDYEPLEDDFEAEEVADSPRPTRGRGRGGRRGQGRVVAVANTAQYGYGKALSSK